METYLNTKQLFSVSRLTLSQNFIFKNLSTTLCVIKTINFNHLITLLCKGTVVTLHRPSLFMPIDRHFW